MEFKEFIDISMARKNELDKNKANFRKKSLIWLGLINGKNQLVFLQI